MKIVVLAGGLSPERDVSLSSGALIANALLTCGHDVLLLDLYLGAETDSLECLLSKRPAEGYSYTVPAEEPDLEKLRAEADNDDSMIGKNVIPLCRAADVVFLALHGSIGENGQLQAVFDTQGITYTGTGYAGSLLAMDKDLSKQLMKLGNVFTPEWKYLRISKTSDSDWDTVPLPCVIKPCSCGSSVGVTIAETGDQLRSALSFAAQYEDHVLIEQKICGREFSVGILDGKALPAIEIIPKQGFYDYKNKYQVGMTEEICPASLTDDLRLSLEQAALAVHRLLRLGFYSRVDFIVDDKNVPYCLEANTLPGMTPTSLLPQEAKACGITYEQLCEKIAYAPLNY